ncbi:MAG: lipopolysaccharide biosynthesis protein [Lewinellaceae bacterium]|nr:lipopolysaccharide biosynthesis protein [Saprospiraceae bacterium]MCB9330162.1 lipopolysaccharide biosynthesis protein [Lewinellaceae bacterium]
MSKSLSERSLAAIVWVLIDKLGGSVINFVVTIVLARLLSPEDFGLVAMVMVFFELSAVFVESGFSTALIREKTISELDKSTTFIFNLVVSVILYGVLFLCAPYIASFFDQSLLTPIIRVLGLSLIVNSFGIVQNSVLTQEINFKALTIVRFIATVVSGACATFLAFQGWGVWALVVRFVLNDLMSTVFLWVITRWRPTMQFSVASFKRLFGFGSKILAAGLLDKFYTHVYKLLIGKFFAAATLGFYTQANNFTMMVINTLFRTVHSVTYPVLSKLQDDVEKLKVGYRKILQLCSFVIIPALVVLGVLAEPVIVTLVGEKWLPSVPMLQLLCLSGLTYHFSSINLNMLLVLGRSDLSLKLEVIKKVNITIAIVVGLQFGIYGLILGEVITSYINLLINVYYSSKFLKYTLSEQIKDILPTVSISALVGVLLFFLKDIHALPGFANMLLVSAIGGILYLALHIWAKTEEINLLRHLILPKTLQLFAKFKTS